MTSTTSILGHPGEAFVLGQTRYNEPGLPPISLAHVLKSHEHLVATVSASLDFDPLLFYQKVGWAFGRLLFVLVTLLLYRQLGLPPWHALLATTLTIGFCSLDMRVPRRTHGNVPLGLYNGKVLQWDVGIPLLLLRLFWVALACIAAVGLSGSAIFLMPALLASLALAHFVLSDHSAAALRVAMSLPLTASTASRSGSRD